MAHTTVKCPECLHQFVVNGRGYCRCGCYLIHHTGKPAYITDEQRVYFWRGSKFVLRKQVV